MPDVPCWRSGGAPIPVYSLSPNKKTTGKSSSNEKNAGPRVQNWPPKFYQIRESCSADRFIPQRRHRNLDAMNYNLRRVPPPSDKPSELDLLGQIESLDTTWRKKLMEKAIERSDVIPGMKDRRVLNFGERENQKSRPEVITRENSLDAIWKSKARSKPLIDHGSFTIRLERSRHILPETIDWGAQNLLAIAIDAENWTDSSVVIFDPNFNNSGLITKPVQKIDGFESRVLVVKWNHAGDRIAIATDSAELKVSSMEKCCWIQKCPCIDETPEKHCGIDCVTWAHSDNEIIICCRESRVTVFSYSGRLILSEFLEIPTDSITSIVLSPNDRYLAVSGFSMILVYSWPNFKHCHEIGPVISRDTKPVAWHPWNPNILCIGCCPIPNSLCVWDVNRRRLLGYKRARCTESAVWKVDQIAWNKLSGELVVRWDYFVGVQCKSVVTVHASLDRVVDAVYEKFRSSDFVWNPDATLFAVRRRSQVKIWKFFGNEAKKWYEESNEKARIKVESLRRRRAIYTDQTKHLEHYCIH